MRFYCVKQFKEQKPILKLPKTYGWFFLSNTHYLHKKKKQNRSPIYYYHNPLQIHFLETSIVFVSIFDMYIRKNYTYTDYLIFSFQNQSLLFTLLMLSYLSNSIFKIESDGVLLLIFAIYLYKAMLNF